MPTMSSQKVVVITGATSGIGASLGQILADNNYLVYSLSRQVKDDPKIKFLQCDVTNPTSVASAIKKVTDQHQKIDVLVNNSGYSLSGNTETITSQQVLDQFSVNLFGVMNVTEAALEWLKKSQGQIINVASIVSEFALPYMTFYSSSKAAVLTYSQKLSNELKVDNVTVNAMILGPVKTNFQQNKSVYLNENKNPNPAIQMLKQLENDSEKKGLTSELVAQKMFLIIDQKKTRFLQVVGLSVKTLIQLKRFLKNDNWMQWIIYKNFKL